MNPISKVEATRKLKRITKTQIANKCGHTITWYADIAKGRRRIYLDDFLKVAESLGEKPEFFLQAN